MHSVYTSNRLAQFSISFLHSRTIPAMSISFDRRVAWIQFTLSGHWLITVEFLINTQSGYHSFPRAVLLIIQPRSNFLNRLLDHLPGRPLQPSPLGDNSLWVYCAKTLCPAASTVIICIQPIQARLHQYAIVHSTLLIIQIYFNNLYIFYISLERIFLNFSISNRAKLSNYCDSKRGLIDTSISYNDIIL